MPAKCVLLAVGATEFRLVLFSRADWSLWFLGNSISSEAPSHETVQFLKFSFRDEVENTMVAVGATVQNQQLACSPLSSFTSACVLRRSQSSLHRCVFVTNQSECCCCSTAKQHWAASFFLPIRGPCLALVDAMHVHTNVRCVSPSLYSAALEGSYQTSQEGGWSWARKPAEVGGRAGGEQTGRREEIA